MHAYPKTLEMALKLLVNFQTPGNRARCTITDRENTGVDFVQLEKYPEAKVEVKTNSQGKYDCLHCEKELLEK